MKKEWDNQRNSFIEIARVQGEAKRPQPKNKTKRVL